MLSVPCSACEQALANTHSQQGSDICVSIGVSGTACLCCWNRKESYLEPDQNRDKERLHRSEYPTDGECTEVAALCRPFPGGARPCYIELVGFSPQPHK